MLHDLWHFSRSNSEWCRRLENRIHHHPWSFVFKDSTARRRQHDFLLFRHVGKYLKGELNRDTSSPCMMGTCEIRDPFGWFWKEISGVPKFRFALFMPHPKTLAHETHEFIEAKFIHIHPWLSVYVSPFSSFPTTICHSAHKHATKNEIACSLQERPISLKKHIHAIVLLCTAPFTQRVDR